MLISLCGEQRGHEEQRRSKPQAGLPGTRSAPQTEVLQWSPPTRSSGDLLSERVINDPDNEP